ncbi:MAG: lipid A biosynthesis acyltransferase [Pedosphaera sp.]|nr:lipid A biosynthesis acyltransferase [Pedosphaera sp.]
MNELLVQFQLFGKAVIITPWKLVGYTGVLIFASRWFVQLAASHTAQRSTFPRLFWYMSLVGSLLLLGYFAFGKNDSVGILSNLFPAFIATYNLILDFRQVRAAKIAETGQQ